MNHSDAEVAPLVALGLSALEANVYCALVAASPQTGYRLARTLGKPAANVYQALDSLVARGAVVIQHGETRLYAAVPPAALVRQLQADFTRRTRDAVAALDRLATTPASDGVYVLETPSGVLERARQLIEQAGAIVLADLFPSAVEWLRPELEAAARRGVDVVVQAYAPAAVDGVDVVVHPRGAALIDRWPGTWCNVVADGAESVLALLSPDGTRVHQALWTASAYLSWVYHSGLEAELAASRLRALVEARGAPSPAVQAALARIDQLAAASPAGFARVRHQTTIEPADDDAGDPADRPSPSPTSPTARDA